MRKNEDEPHFSLRFGTFTITITGKTAQTIMLKKFSADCVIKLARNTPPYGNEWINCIKISKGSDAYYEK